MKHTLYDQNNPSSRNHRRNNYRQISETKLQNSKLNTSQQIKHYIKKKSKPKKMSRFISITHESLAENNL